MWDLIGVDRPDWRVEIDHHDLYPDAVECVAAARRAGLVIGIAGNQPTGIEAALHSAGLEADFIASSEAWGVAKPDRRFFLRVTDGAEVPARAILYVGDRLDNDVVPTHQAGMRTAFIGRGPWGYLHAMKPEVALADLRLDSLHELASALAPEQH